MTFFGYKIVQELPLEELPKRFSKNKRLQVFIQHGCKCVSCGLEGGKLMLGVDRGGGKHWDVYADNGVPLTVDHIIPKSKGGSDKPANLQPMCAPCNFAKADNTELVFSTIEDKAEKAIRSGEYKRASKFDLSSLIGESLWRLKRGCKVTFMGVAQEVCKSPYAQGILCLKSIRGEQILYLRVNRNLYVKTQ